MSEATQQPIEPTDELATLRRVNAELLAKSATRKAKIAELEVAAVTLQGKLNESESTVHELSVTRPLKAIAESISIAPDVFLEHLNKSYRVEAHKGELSLLTPDGKPALNGDKAVPCTSEGLTDFLKNPAHPQAKLFSSILIVNRASGASGTGFGVVRKGRSSETPAPSKRPQFGLR
jgi:hypothetical protein